MKCHLCSKEENHQKENCEYWCDYCGCTYGQYWNKIFLDIDGEVNDGKYTKLIDELFESDNLLKLLFCDNRNTLMQLLLRGYEIKKKGD